MNLLIKIQPILALLLLSSIGLSGQIRIEGEVYDHETNEVVVGAHIWSSPDTGYAVSDEQGNFVLEIDVRDSLPYLQLFASLVGATNAEMQLEILPQQRHYHVHLFVNEHECLKCEHTDVVLVEETALSLQNTQATQLISDQELQENLQGNFAKSLERIAGVNTINVGVGIAKPVIRGLAANRILVNQNGISQQGQQWGNDHGLEIDALSVDRMELVKGPTSLLYGSDGLGGAINILPERIAPHNTLKASVQGLYKSNNGHWGTSAHLSGNWHNWFVQARYTRQEFGDYRVPADTFVYNTFVLPIFNNQLKNTAGKEENFHFNFGTVQPWGSIRWSNSHYGLRAGIFSGAMGVPRAYELTPDESTRDIDFPSQTVSHFKSIVNLLLQLPHKAQLKADIGYQRNLRREFSFPHFHNRIALANDDQLALELLLQTFTASLRYQQPAEGRWRQRYGAMLQYQDNQRGGFDYLLPDFTTWRTGAYGLIDYSSSSRFRLEMGLRADYANNMTQAHEQPIFVDNGVTTLALVSPATDQHFFNLSGAFGLWYSLIPEKWVFRAHLGKSFRVPYPNETVSNGVHHGTFRHERGNPNLTAEQGYQLDLSTDGQLNKLSWQVAGFFNYFDNFIYLSPSARFSPLPDAGQLYEYVQYDALFAGGELSWNYQLTNFLRLQQAYDYVWNVNVQTGLGLPFTPPGAVLSGLRFELPKAVGKHWRSGFLRLSHRYRLAQNRVDRNELATPAYHLLDISAGTTLQLGQQRFILRLQVQNLLNTPYLEHTSRYRLLNLPEQGRNVVLSLKIPFEVKLKER